MRDIAIAVVCYNNEQEIITFTRELVNQKNIDRIQLLVTCNSVDDYLKFKKDLLKILPSAQVFNSEKNLGYLPGCLYGLQNSNCDYSWAMICNTDISFCQNDFFDTILDNTNDNIWCIGPDITLSSTGIHQNPFLLNRPSKHKTDVWRMVYSYYPLYLLYFKLSALKQELNTSQELISQNVYAVHGSCFFLRNECVNRIIQEKADIFMYCEELFIGEIVRENNKYCYFNKDIGIVHNENQVTGNIGNRRKQKWFKESINYIIRRFY